MNKKFKSGLILEGGAMRGMFTSGVLDVFLENGIEFDGAIGVSAGATFGCNLKSRQIGRAIRYNKRFAHDWRYCSLRSLVFTGDMYGARFCYDTLPNKLDPFDRQAYQENPMEFYVGATDVRTGKTVYHRCADGGEKDMAWMRASASMPLASRPVEIDGFSLLDGGIVDPTPYLYMEKLGYGRNVVILTQPAAYRKQKSALTPLTILALHRYPALQEAMRLRPQRYNAHIAYIARKEQEGHALVIRPPEPLNIRRTEKDPSELERAYRIGRREAGRRIEEILRFLEM